MSATIMHAMEFTVGRKRMAMLALFSFIALC